jgi:hypothetical protein
MAISKEHVPGQLGNRARPGFLTATALVVVALVLAGEARAANLVTPSYLITITSNCPEGEVTCQDMSYRGTNRRNGRTIELKGRTLFALCKDGVTPCHHTGYEFRSGRTVYVVSVDGWLEVLRGGKVLLHEGGTWD